METNCKINRDSCLWCEYCVNNSAIRSKVMGPFLLDKTTVDTYKCTLLLKEIHTHILCLIY